MFAQSATYGATTFPAVRDWHWYPALRHRAEFLGALVLFVLSSPLVLLAAVVVKLTSRGPAFYSQVRLGKDGRWFHIHKIRTMTVDCEKVSGARWCTTGDPRVTPVGRFLRGSKIDELPQLWNVLRGEMSLIGPRPERPELVPALERAIPHYRDRLRVRPGLTGLAQVQLPADTGLDSVRRKLAYDLYYIRHQGPVLDLQILVATACYILRVPFPLTRRVLRVPSGDAVERPYYDAVRRETKRPHLQTA